MKKKIVSVIILLVMCLLSLQVLEVKAQDEKTPIVTPGNNPMSIDIRGMTSVGDAKIVGLYVHFPDEDFYSDDTLESMNKLINGDSDINDAFYPFESMKAYYERASYGKLHISGNVFEYYACKESSEYYSIKELVEEAMEFYDSSIDFSNYDMDNDGKIDGIYVHVPKYNVKWGDQWWSQCFGEPGIDNQYDGKHVGAVVILHNNSNTKYGCSVACHETGHVLGLPDLYNTSDKKVDYIDRDGPLTWDLMNNNIGDINGYFKMLLGWIDYNDVTRIIANDNGIDVKKGNTTINHIDYSGEYISVEEVVRSLDKDPVSDGYTNTPGDLVIVSNEDNGLFSKFYLIQYDNTVGNQTANYKVGDDLIKVPSGFRIYRVNAELDNMNQFLYKNTDGRPFEQLIELLDYDLYDGHTPKENGVVVSSINGGFNCYIPVGSTIDSSTTPSTNFYEDLAGGFTGLSFTIKENNLNSGRIEIGYSSANRVSTDDFYLKLGEASYASNDINVEVESAWKIRELKQVAVKIVFSYKDGSSLVWDADAFLSDSRKSISVSNHFNYDAVKNTDKIELVFEPGALLIGDNEATGRVYNDEIRLELNISTVCDTVEKIINVDDEKGNMTFTSNVVVSDEYAYQVHVDRGAAYLLKVPVAIDAKGENTPLNYDREIIGVSAEGFNLYKCSEDYLIFSYVDNRSERIWLWINLKTNTVDYTYSLLSYSVQDTVCPDGNIVMVYSDLYNNTKSLRVVSFVPDNSDLEIFEELLTDETLGKINAAKHFTGVSDGRTKVALPIGVTTMNNVQAQLLIIDEDELVSLVKNKQLNSLYATKAEYYGEMPFTSNYYVCDIVETEDKCLLITVNYLDAMESGRIQQKLDLFLIKEVDKSKVELLGRINIKSVVPSVNPLYKATVAGKDGKLALSFSKGGDDKAIQICFINTDDIINYSNTFECGKYLCSSSGSNGFFNKDNQFCFFEWEEVLGEDGYYRYALAAYRVNSKVKESINDIGNDVSEESSPNTGDVNSINTLTLFLVISLVVFVLEVKYGRRISSR